MFFSGFNVEILTFNTTKMAFITVYIFDVFLPDFILGDTSHMSTVNFNICSYYCYIFHATSCCAAAPHNMANTVSDQIARYSLRETRLVFRKMNSTSTNIMSSNILPSRRA